MKIRHIVRHTLNYQITRFRTERCYDGNKKLYALNRQKTGLNRLTQWEFFNVIDEPKFNNALNDDNYAPILDCILGPIVRIVCISLLIDKSNKSNITSAVWGHFTDVADIGVFK